MLKQRFSSPSAIFASLYSLFSGSPASDGAPKHNIFDQDFVALISRILLPFTLNKTLFRNSGFIVKAIVGLVSQKASGFINEKSVTSIWDRAKSVVAHLINKADEKLPKRKGRAAVSEAY
ncbi:MAG: hypothetical protein M3N14_07505 [Bacteroidota bacterium]|nr:hypothetical protein [Bacteroidota bacterium]